MTTYRGSDFWTRVDRRGGFRFALDGFSLDRFLASCDLGFRLAPFRADVKEVPIQRYAADASRFDEAEERVVDADPEAELQLGMSIAGLGIFHDVLDGAFQRAVSREGNSQVMPEAALVELRDFPKGVVSTSVAVAGQVVDGREPTEDAHARAGSKGFKEGVEGDDRPLSKEP